MNNSTLIRWKKKIHKYVFIVKNYVNVTLFYVNKKLKYKNMLDLILLLL